MIAIALLAVIATAACSDDDSVATSATGAPSTPAVDPSTPSTVAATVGSRSETTAATPATPASAPTTSSTVAAAPVPCAEQGAPVAPLLGAPTPMVIPDDAAVVTPTDSVDDVLRGLTDATDPVVVLAAGAYPPITVSNGGPLTIVGASRDDVTVAGFVLDGARDVTIAGLTIADNPDPSSSAVTITGRSTGIRLTDVTIDPLHNAGVAVIDGSSDVVVEHSRITGEHVTKKLGRARNILIGEGSPDASRWVERVRISDNELVAAAADGIQVAGARDVTIAGNFIHDLQQNGDHNDGIQVVAVDGAVIESNTLTSLTAPSQDQSILLGHLGGGAGPDADPRMRVRNVVVQNNLVHHWSGAGITVNGTIDVTIVNNTSVDNHHDGKPFPGLLIDSRYFPNENLRVINNIASDIDLVGGEPPTVQHGNVIETVGAGPEDLTADPCFSDRTTYALTPQSPAIDFGSADGAPNVDIDGRPRQGAPDAGALEGP